MRRFPLALAIALPAFAAAPAATARVFDETDSGFVIRLGVEVPASPEEVWEAMIRPEQWWDAASTFSGDAANLSLDPRGGGCFCEVLPDELSPGAAPRGSVEHMRIVYAERPRALRMTGALGPIQPDAVTGVMTMIIQPVESGARIVWEYAVGGRPRKPGMAAALDAALAKDMLGLAGRLGVRTGAEPGAGRDEQNAADAPGNDDAGPKAADPEDDASSAAIGR